MKYTSRSFFSGVLMFGPRQKFLLPLPVLLFYSVLLYSSSSKKSLCLFLPRKSFFSLQQLPRIINTAHFHNHGIIYLVFLGGLKPLFGGGTFSFYYIEDGDCIPRAYLLHTTTWFLELWYSVIPCTIYARYHFHGLIL